ncbi:hypothetical protein CEUSTIGMA_g8987.t1 [Chlamydomonas eustigma]|uniref:25S rRNA (uridine-N(3))-methyltransferase BMT5-like domain-containing protein n=1 Tax=Chlamydomonas eustigma TaxID=1157962 RepID=A0A250XF64_9CHLO|nr:hypothetical protein CEUSTIGMA_g8987.t1 [Chlamydomonas eustigma]|eukprot:GAX81559.1 hypothetical protein CEUSTIGMA_g8987.t1 [Chlamydomonas eustigma]
MAKKGRKLAIKQSVKALYDRKRVARSRPGRPDGKVSTSGAMKKRGIKNQRNLASKSQQQKAAPELPNCLSNPKSNNTPFSTDDTILLVGEGNFSFSAALATLLGSAELITATCFDTEQEVQRKYPDAARHMATVKDLGGIVLHGVDATKLGLHEGLKAGRSNGRFSKIVFNFPHAGAGIKDQDRNILTNQHLLAGFFSSARQFLSSPLSGVQYTAQGPITPPSGQILVTLKTGIPYDDWGLVSLGKAAGYFVHHCTEFKSEFYPGYEHRRTIGWDATKEGNVEIEGKACKTWAFCDKKGAAAVASSRKLASKRAKKGQQGSKSSSVADSVLGEDLEGGGRDQDGKKSRKEKKKALAAKRKRHQADSDGSSDSD